MEGWAWGNVGPWIGPLPLPISPPLCTKGPGWSASPACRGVCPWVEYQRPLVVMMGQRRHALDGDLGQCTGEGGPPISWGLTQINIRSASKEGSSTGGMWRPEG